MTIWKYQFLPQEIEKTIEVPYLNKLLKIHAQGQYISIWFLVDFIKPEKQHYTFRIIGTGNIISDEEKFNNEFVYIDTVFIDPFVWHVFKKI